MQDANTIRQRLRTATLLTLLCLGSFAVPAAQAQGEWRCDPGPWSAWTTERRMEGITRFECGGGICGDSSHTQPTSWVDFVGGISEQCDNHSTSYYGPLSGEWNGCVGDPNVVQTSTGRRDIESVDQGWDRWPAKYASLTRSEPDISHLTGSDNMRDPFGTVYDLDGCLFKDLIATIYWGNFPVTATLVDGDPSDPSTDGYAVWTLSGSSAGVKCSGVREPLGVCGSKICSNLHVAGSYRCDWVGDPPESGGCNPSTCNSDCLDNIGDVCGSSSCDGTVQCTGGFCSGGTCSCNCWCECEGEGSGEL